MGQCENVGMENAKCDMSLEECCKAAEEKCAACEDSEEEDD